MVNRETLRPIGRFLAESLVLVVAFLLVFRSLARIAGPPGEDPTYCAVFMALYFAIAMRSKGVSL